MTDERHAELERKMEREIAKGYRKAERTPEAELPADWEDQIVEDAIDRVFQSREEYNEWAAS
jgi:hypothetical protein